MYGGGSVGVCTNNNERRRGHKLRGQRVPGRCQSGRGKIGVDAVLMYEIIKC